MKLDKLEPGTKLMWDPKSNYPGTDTPIIYPVTAGHKNPDYNRNKSVKIHTASGAHYMGIEQGFIRLPTDSELEKLIWPEISL